MGLAILSILLLVHVFFWIAWKYGKFSVLDIAWGLGFVVVALVCYLQNYPTGPKALLLVMVTVWGLRLAGYIYGRSRGQGEDPRYQAFKDRLGGDYLRVGYKKIFLLQGAMMFLISLPIQLGMSSDLERFGIKQIAGFLIWLLGFALEVWADTHLHKFRSTPVNKGQLCTSGPWVYCRFPNYLGEMLVWWGIYLFIFGFWTAWTIVGPLTICYTLLKITGIPLTEKRYLQRADYRAYAARVPRLIPFTKPRLPAGDYSGG